MNNLQSITTNDLLFALGEIESAFFKIKLSKLDSEEKDLINLINVNRNKLKVLIRKTRLYIYFYKIVSIVYDSKKTIDRIDTMINSVDRFKEKDDKMLIQLSSLRKERNRTVKEIIELIRKNNM